MTELFSAIGNFGFPIVVASYLLFRFEKKVEALSENIRKNTEITEKLVEAIKKSNKGIRISNKIKRDA